jgi:hypothetical protein
MDISIAGICLPDRVKSFWSREKAVKARVHNYTRQTEGCHYFVSPAEERDRLYMTAEQAGVHCDDYIVLEGETRYRVEGIEYYGDNPNLWTALLVKC